MATGTATLEYYQTAIDTSKIKTVYTVVSLAALMSLGSVSVKEPMCMPIIPKISISTNCAATTKYNGNITLSWDGITAMTAKINESLARLDEIAALSENWNGHGAMAFSAELIAKAKKIVYALSTQPIILPTGRDSIQMEYERPNGDYLEFELFETGRLKMFFYSHDGLSETKDVEVSAMNEAVTSFYER